MRFTWPYAFYFLFLVPAIIIMYLFKQRYMEYKISSTLLWDEVLKNNEAYMPFEKLKKNLLMFLQILLIILLTLSLSNPFIKYKGGNFENIVIAIDTSGSMNTMIDGKKRIELAKEAALNIVKSSKSGTFFTLITFNKNPKIEISNSKSKSVINDKINSIKAEYFPGNINEAVSLINSLSEEYKSFKVYIMSDYSFKSSSSNTEVISFGGKIKNASIDYISSEKKDNSITTLLRVSNNGKDDLKGDVVLYNDNKLLSIEEIELKANEVKSIYFKDVPLDSRYLRANIDIKDDLLEDNTAYEALKFNDEFKVLLVSKGNTFIEKALKGAVGIELSKSDAKDLIDGYDLYIIDGISIDSVPKKGSLLFVNSNMDSLFTFGEETGPKDGVFLKNSVNRYIEGEKISILKYRPINIPSYGKELIKAGEDCAAFIGEKDGRKIAALSFDLHKTDFVLSPMFPIFIYNLSSYYMNSNLTSNPVYNCGDMVDILPLPKADSIKVINPKGQEFKMDLGENILYFRETNETGIYKIIENSGDEKIEELFAVNFPTVESKFQEANELDEKVSGRESVSGGIYLKDFLLILAIIFLIVEWGVYIREN